MQSLELYGLEQVQKAFERFPDAMREAKSDAFEAVGQNLLLDVQRRIGGSGRVAGVQEYKVGSGKGYVAVRAKANTELNGYAAGYITNSLENGHDQETGRFVSSIGARLVRDRVPGKYMYQMTEAHEAEPLAEQAAQYIRNAAEQALNGG